jgi:hypothetical protein
MKIALFAPVEADLRDVNSAKDGFSRYFEQEAIKTFTCWRKNGGWLKDIPIYAVCPTAATISDETRTEFRKLNVTYIEAYEPTTISYQCGFWNIPLVGRWMENHINADVFIKIDLDMYLIRPLPYSLFDNLEKSIVGLHDHLANPHLNIVKEEYPAFKYFFNTGFTITTPESRFFARQMEYLMQMDYDFEALGVDGFKKKYGPTIVDNIEDFSDEAIEHRMMEEMCVSIMYQNGIPITPFENFYLETDDYELDNEIDYDLEQIYFIHEHIYQKIAKNKMINRVRYKKAFDNLPGYNFYYDYCVNNNH